MRQIQCTPQGEIPFGTLSLQGDQALAGFEELAMPLSHSLYNFARWLAHNQHDAEDLVQETYLKALRSFASFEPGSNFRAWMFKILKNTFLTACSKQEHRTTIPIDIEENSWALPATSDTPESLLIEHFDIDAVRTAIEQLSATHREVILLCDVEEASYREIAEILSIPIGTVMSRLARARKALCELLGRPPVHHSRAAWLIPSKCTRRMLELPKRQKEKQAMRDVSIDRNFPAEKLPLDLSDLRLNFEELLDTTKERALTQIAPFVSTRVHSCDLGARFSNAYFEICRPKTVRPRPDSSKST